MKAQEAILYSSVQESNRTHACPGEQVVYTCEVTGSILRWIVEPYVTENDAVSFLFLDVPGTSFVDPPEAVRVLISTSPFVSTLTLRPTDDLMNTTVICQSNRLQEIR